MVSLTVWKTIRNKSWQVELHSYAVITQVCLFTGTKITRYFLTIVGILVATEMISLSEHLSQFKW